MIGQVLKDVRVLVCRPEPAASELADVLKSVGASVQVLPTIEITPFELPPPSRNHILNLDQYSHVVTVSPNAAQIALEHIDSCWPQYPVQQQWHAIGRKTAQILSNAGLSLARPKGDMTSEELLKLPDFAKVNGEKILVLKGKGGREMIVETLTRRGAKVDTVELYLRQRPRYDEATLKEALIEFCPHFIVALSAETLENLISLNLSIRAPIAQSALIVPSSRVMNIALEHGFKLIYIPNNLMPIDIIKAIRQANNEVRAF